MLSLERHPVSQAFRHTLTVATGFWGACLVLTTLEAALGANSVIGSLFFLSIPLLVGGLTWANGVCVSRPRGAGSVVMLGVVVLLSSSLIILLGLLAASRWLHFMHTGALSA